MTMDSKMLIDHLAEEGAAVRPLSLTEGRGLAATAGFATVAAFVGAFGFRDDIVAGHPQALPLVVASLFGLLAVAAGWSATRMARPAVGGSQGGALWVFAAVLLLPAISLIELASGEHMDVAFGLRCLFWGIGASVITAVAMTMWLRRGAPVMPEKTGLLAGLTAGSVGALALTLECNGSALSHLAIFHVGIVAVWAVVGRTLIARALRW